MHGRGASILRAAILLLLGAEQEIAVDPSDGSGTGAHSDGAAPAFQDFQPLTVTDHCHGGLARSEFLSQIQSGGGDEAFADIDIDAVLNPRDFVGRAPEQVDEFIAECVEPVRVKYRAVLGQKADLKV